MELAVYAQDVFFSLDILRKQYRKEMVCNVSLIF